MTFHDDRNDPEDDINLKERLRPEIEIPSSLSGSQNSEPKAQEVIAEILENPFANFSSLDYLKKFYPEMDLEPASAVFAILEKVQIESGRKVIDLGEITKSLNVGSLEALENICIYEFFLRTVLPALLEQWPEDHLKMLDIGAGPTVYQHIPLMGVADSIVHAEFLASNREEALRWKDKKSTHSWESYFALAHIYLRDNLAVFAKANPAVQEYIKSISQSTNLDAENILREKISAVVPCNAFKDGLGLPKNNYDPEVVCVSREASAALATGNFGLAHVVTSNFCIESATSTLEQWKEGIKNIANQVSIDGFLLMTAIRNADWYEVGEEKVPAVPIDANMLEAQLEAEGLKILALTDLSGSDKEKVGYDGMVFVLAQRK